MGREAFTQMAEEARPLPVRAEPILDIILHTGYICSTARLQTASQVLSRGHHCKSWRPAVYLRRSGGLL